MVFLYANEKQIKFPFVCLNMCYDVLSNGLIGARISHYGDLFFFSRKKNNFVYIYNPNYMVCSFREVNFSL